MKRTIAAVFTTAGFLFAAGAAQAAQPVRPLVPRPQNVQARLACNNIKDPAQRKACIEKVCAPVIAANKQACINGTGAFAAKPAPKPGPKPVVLPKPPVKLPVKPPVAGKPPVGKPTVALLNQKRAQLSSLRNEVVNLCRQIYDGKAEADCVAAAFPAAPKAKAALPKRGPKPKPTN